MEELLGTLVSHEALASWVGAIASFAAVFWGVWQVSRDARARRTERNEHTHETISCAEDVLITWDKLATAIKRQDLESEALSEFTRRLGPHRLQLQRCIDTLDLLVVRPALSDGAIKCAVQARYLAKQLDGVMGGNNDASAGHAEFKDVVRELLKDIKRIRHSHRIRSRRFKYVYQNVDEAAIDRDVKSAPVRR